MVISGQHNFGKVVVQDVLDMLKPALLPSPYHMDAQILLPMVSSDNSISFARSELAGNDMALAWKIALWSAARCDDKDGKVYKFVVEPSCVRRFQPRRLKLHDFYSSVKPEGRILCMLINPNGGDKLSRRLFVCRLHESVR